MGVGRRWRARSIRATSAGLAGQPGPRSVQKVTGRPSASTGSPAGQRDGYAVAVEPVGAADLVSGDGHRAWLVHARDDAAGQAPDSAVEGADQLRLIGVEAARRHALPEGGEALLATVRESVAHRVRSLLVER